MTDEFQCSGCGACCKRAGMSGMMPQREDGACIHLAEDNKCKIYETRPIFCRVKEGYQQFKDVLGMTETEFFIQNNLLCNQWIKEDGLDESLLIDIGKYDAKFS